VSQPGTTDADDVAPRLIATFKLRDGTNAQCAGLEGIPLGGINDPLNVPLCTAADLATFGGRDAWTDETAWNYEAASSRACWGGRGAVGVSAFYMDIRDLQATVTAGSCSSRVVFNVPKARSQGVELEFEAAPNRNIDFAVSTSFNDAELRSDVPPVDVDRHPERRRACRPCRNSSCDGGDLPVAGEAERAWPTSPARISTSARATRRSAISCSDARPDVVRRQHHRRAADGTRLSTYDPKLPAYDLLNLRAGVRHGNLGHRGVQSTTSPTSTRCCRSNPASAARAPASAT
jgi:iron complex outermembrane receptor protein